MAAGSDISNVLVKIVYLPNLYFSGVVQNTSSYNNSHIFFPKSFHFASCTLGVCFFVAPDGLK